MNMTETINDQQLTETSPIFILGSPRSGTTIITLALREGANIPGYQEGHFLPLLKLLIDEVEKYYEQFSNVANKEEANVMLAHIKQKRLENLVIKAFHNLLLQIHSEQVWLDKTPGELMIKTSPHILNTWSKSRFIFAKRRSIECIQSRLKKFPKVSFESHCIQWKKCMQSWLNVKNSLKGHYIEIEQRDIALNPQKTAQKMVHFLGLEKHYIQQIEKIFTNKRPQHTGGKENEKSISIEELGWTKPELEIFRKHCNNLNKKLGYSESSSYYL